MCEARPCRPNSSPPRSPGGPTFLRPQVMRSPPGKVFSQPSPLGSWKWGATGPFGESQARGVPRYSARPRSMPRSGEDVEGEAATRPKAKHSHAAGGAVVEGERLYSRDLLRPAYPPEQIPPRQGVARLVCEHKVLLLGFAPGAANVGRIPCQRAR